jgi:hypothetical protein
MKIPSSVQIPEHKLTAYLLKPRQADDKSGFLAQAGFGLENWPLLLSELRRLIAENEAKSDRFDEYGTFYQVTGQLTGPNGRKLEVVTVWLCLKLDGSYRFITLKPNR